MMDVNAPSTSAKQVSLDESEEEVAIIKNSGPLPCQELTLQQLVVFLDGATKIAKVRNVDVAHAAIKLLKIDAARDAALEHIYNLFDESVNNYILNVELEDNANIANNVAADEAVINDIHKILSEFIENNPEIWAPIISSWSLDLLGYLGSKYADRRIVPHSSSLPEVLQLWMTCRPTRTLIDLTTQCLSTLINSNPDSCIDALIETSVQHSPHFDWVVAHIGSCFPTTVITRVLACGLKDFYTHQDVMDESQIGASSKKAPKIASVVGILGHLANHHNKNMRIAILSLFKESLLDTANREQLATGPFLLHLAAMSDVLSDVISSEFVKVVTPETLNMMSCQVEKWRSAKIPGTDGLNHLVVHLLLRSDGGGQVIRCLLDIMPPSSVEIHSVIREAAGLVLDSVLLEIQRRVYSGAAEIPLLRFLKAHIADLSSNLTNNDGNKTSWVFNLIKLICVYGKEQVTVFVIGYLLGNIEKVALFVSALSQETQMSQPNALCTTISHQMAELKSGKVKNPVTLIQNITSLCQMNQLHKLITDGVGPNLEVLAGQITKRNTEYSDAVIELLSISVIPEQMPVTSLFKVGCSAVGYFFNLLFRNNMDYSKKVGLVNTVKCLLAKLSKQTAAQHMILRMLLEGVLDSKHVTLFESNNNLGTSSKGNSYISLQDENVKYITSITLPPSHSSVFHSGIIGSGLRVPHKVSTLAKGESLLNKQFMLDIIQACCKPSWRFPLDEPSIANCQSLIPGMKIVALLMVELISPDVMFNGLPWPDEDYQKVTIERDLHIKRMFEKHPILWDLLTLIATIHPSLCYCSVLLRAVMAVLLSHWGSCQEKTTMNSPKQLEMTQRLINIMAIGQILPPPLSFIDEVLALVTPYEAFNLLSDIWQYMRDNVPSPAMFSSKDPSSPRVWRNFSSMDGKISKYCDKKYTNRLRFILFANIEKFGAVYAKFFPADC